MGKNQLQEKVRTLRKKIDDREMISDYATLFKWEAENEGKNIRPKLSSKLKKQLQETGFYLDL